MPDAEAAGTLSRGAGPGDDGDRGRNYRVVFIPDYRGSGLRPVAVTGLGLELGGALVPIA